MHEPLEATTKNHEENIKLEKKQSSSFLSGGNGGSDSNSDSDDDDNDGDNNSGAVGGGGTAANGTNKDKSDGDSDDDGGGTNAKNNMKQQSAANLKREEKDENMKSEASAAVDDENNNKEEKKESNNGDDNGIDDDNDDDNDNIETPKMNKEQQQQSTTTQQEKKADEKSGGGGTREEKKKGDNPNNSKNGIGDGATGSSSSGGGGGPTTGGGDGASSGTSTKTAVGGDAKSTAASAAGANGSTEKNMPQKVAADNAVTAGNNNVSMDTKDATAAAGGGGKMDDKKADAASTAAMSATTATAASSAPAAPPPPVMKGTFSYDLEKRHHLIRGMWNYENSNELPAQRFELSRTLDPEENIEELPKDGTFHGSFSLAYFHVTSKGKRKERSKLINESGVKIKFTPVPDKARHYTVKGTGTNQFGVFHIEGTAIPSTHPNDPTLHIELRKRYEPTPTPPAAAASGVAAAGTTKADGGGGGNVSGNENNDNSNNSGPLPPPYESSPKGVVCLRGKLYKQESHDIGLAEVVHRISGMWASGLDFLLDPTAAPVGMTNKFEYEHKSSVPSNTFPVSGRYSGWFDLTNDDGTKNKINERDVTLRFRKNSAGYYNVEGKGSNLFGKYTITGSLTDDNIITIFRHFQPRKLKNKSITGASSAASLTGGDPGVAGTIVGGVATAAATTRRPSVGPVVEKKLKLDDIQLPPEADAVGDARLEPLQPPEHGTYSAVSRGSLRLNDDGSHTCQGTWAVTREHLLKGNTQMISKFNFRLEAHFAQDALAKIPENSGRSCPLDSDMYKGSFQLKKQGTRYQTIIDHQVVMKFRINTQGSYNVYGKGFNEIGEFNLLGTMIVMGKAGGQVELYRIYPPEKLAAQQAPAASAPTGTNSISLASKSLDNMSSSVGLSSISPMPKPSAVASTLPGPPPSMPLARRESTRLVKLPSKLEDDDPAAMLTRTMSKCSQILRFISDKDTELGGFFRMPVDPVALGIPTYHQIIKEPMDLGTIYRRMESNAIDNPEEFGRLVRLVFENAVTFNVDPGHSVHQAARALLTLFNQKFRDVERVLPSLKKAQSDNEEKGKRKGKGEDGKKRKRQSDEPKSLKKQRLEEAQAMAAANASSVAALVSAAPTVPSAHVTRTEFNILLSMIEQLQRHVVQTHTALADLSPGDEDNAKGVSSATAAAPSATSSVVSKAPAASASTAAAPERKKPAKRKSETAAAPAPAPAPAPPPVPDDDKPLSLEEQEVLTETINELPPQHLGGVIQIIREAAPVGADEDEIDLEIDQLDTKTQRKLLKHVLKFVKKPKKKLGTKKRQASATKKDAAASKKAKTAPSPAPAPAPSPAPAPAPPKPKASDSFFAFGNKSDSDSDSEEDEVQKVSQRPGGGKAFLSATSKDFQLGSGLGDHDDDDHDDDLGNGGFAASWNISKSATDKTKDDDDDDDDEEGAVNEDDAWGDAREHMAMQKKREAERRAREEKMKAEAEEAKRKRLEEAVEHGQMLKAQLAQKEEEDAKLREEEQKKKDDEAELARQKMRAQLSGVEQTVDFDEQREMMKEYEQTMLDQDYAGASPSSDFGF